MPMTASAPPVLGQLDELDALLDELAAVELEPADVDGALALARRVERLDRRLHSVKIRVIDAF